jgi:hypothetical protein
MLGTESRCYLTLNTTNFIRVCRARKTFSFHFVCEALPTRISNLLTRMHIHALYPEQKITTRQDEFLRVFGFCTKTLSSFFLKKRLEKTQGHPQFELTLRTFQL